jgi:hypothetical protein
MIPASRQLDKKDNEEVKNSFFNKMRTNDTSILWKFLFFFLKYIHILTLFLIFFLGVTNIDLYNLGLMFFFIVFTAEPSWYRNGSIFLIIFAGFFIWGEYYWTLIYNSV